MPTSKVVKRYANRKLYDTERSCYVTLEDISLMIKTGDEVKVIDNKSGEDLTSVTLAQIIFENEKKRAFMPLGLLRGLIKDSGEALSDFAKERVGQAQLKASVVRDSAVKLKEGFQDQIERVIGTSGEDKSKSNRSRLVSELVLSSKTAFEELRQNVENKISGPMAANSRFASLGRDMEEIRRRMAELEERLENLPS